MSINIPYFVFMAESEGLITCTREGAIQNVIRQLRQVDDPNDPEVQAEIFHSVGLNPFSLSELEILRIEAGVER